MRLRNAPIVSQFAGLGAAQEAQRLAHGALQSAQLLRPISQKSLERDVEDQDYLRKTFEVEDAIMKTILQ